MNWRFGAQPVPNNMPRGDSFHTGSYYRTRAPVKCEYGHFKRRFLIPLLARVLVLVPFVPCHSVANDCPDFTNGDSAEKELNHDEFQAYLEDPAVINFGLSDAFVCYRLKLFSRPWTRDGGCSHASSSIMHPDDLGPGMNFGQLQVTSHRKRCEYVEQIGLIPQGAKP